MQDNRTIPYTPHPTRPGCPILAPDAARVVFFNPSRKGFPDSSKKGMTPAPVEDFGRPGRFKGGV